MCDSIKETSIHAEIIYPESYVDMIRSNMIVEAYLWVAMGHFL